MTGVLDTIRRSAGLYPTTICYFAGVGILMALADGLIRLDVAILALGLVTLINIVISAKREVRAVHLLLAQQREELLRERERREHGDAVA